MLVLCRKVGEEIIVGETGDPAAVVIKLVRIEGNQARIGVTALAATRVDRMEVRKRLDRERAEAPAGGPEDDVTYGREGGRP